MLSLRRNIRTNYDKRGTDMAQRISDEDLLLLDMSRSKMYMWPAISLVATYGIGWIVGRMNFSGMMANHLIEEEDSIEAQMKVLRRTKFSKFMKGQGMLLVGAASFFLGWLYHYGVRYNLYLKYQNLVNSYARAATEEYLRHKQQQAVSLPL